MGAEDGMWTEAHRARHEPGLKGLVAACAVEEIAGWLERADPPRSGRATPVRRVVGAIAWHLRVGRPLARPAGRLAAVADRLRLVPPLARAGPVRRPAAGRGAPPAARGREAAGADAVAIVDTQAVRCIGVRGPRGSDAAQGVVGREP